MLHGQRPLIEPLPSDLCLQPLGVSKIRTYLCNVEQAFKLQLSASGPCVQVGIELS